MSLLKQLFALSEASVKDAAMDIILGAIDSVDVTGLSYDKAVRKISQYVIDNNSHDMFGGDSISTVEDMVRAMFDPEDLNEETDDNWPKLISAADEFRVEVDEDEQVSILDGEHTVRLTMPLVIWKQLTR